jgi:hypothetical protein
LISLVRSNENGVVGFLADQRRLVVAMSRARICRWIFGDVNTLLMSGSKDLTSIIMEHVKAGRIVHILELNDKQASMNLHESSEKGLLKKHKHTATAGFSIKRN